MSTELDDHKRVLSEAAHDLANHIHRSYYFLELLADAIGPDNPAAGSLVSRLKDSLADIESDIRSTMAFIRPVELHRLRVRMDDLVSSLRQHVGLRPVELGGDIDAGRCEVEVDPGRISEALGLLCKAAAGEEEDVQIPILVELIEGNPVGLRIHRTQGTSGEFRPDLTLAQSARIARLHGGTLDFQDGNSSSVTLRLPVAQGI